MARSFATAYIEILPDFNRFRSQVQSQVSGAVREVGNAATREATREAGNASQAASRSIAGISRSMTALGGAMSSVGSNMTRAITVPVAAAGVAIFNTGRQFESSMQKIVGLVGVSQKQVNIWSDEILKMGPATRRPVTELADALYFATSSGISLSKAMGVVEISGKAATAGLGNTATVADTLTSAMNAYAKSGLTAAQAGDILVSAVRDGKVEAEEFAPVLGRLLPTASNLGISFSDMAGTLAVMSRTGLDASEAATSLNAIMTAFLKPAEQSKKALASIGLSAGEVREILSKPGGLVTAMHLLNNRTQGNDEVLARIVPNVRAYRGVMNVLAQDLPGVSKVLDNARNSTGMLDQAFGAMANTAEGRYNQAMSQVQASFIVLSRSVMPLVAAAFARISNAIAAVTNAYNGLSSSSQRFVLISLAILAAAGPVIVVIGKLISTVGLLMRAYTIIRGAVIAFNSSMFMARVAMIVFDGVAAVTIGWIGLIVGAIVALAAGVVYAYRHWDAFRNVVNTVWAFILSVSQSAVNWFVNTAWPAMLGFFRVVGQWALWLWRNAMVPAWNGILNASRAVVSWYSTNVHPILVAVFRGIGTVLIWLWQNVFVPAWNGILAVVRVAVTVVGAIVTGMTAVFRAVAPVISWLWKNVVVPAFNGIVAVTRILGSVISTIFNGVVSVIRAVVAPVVSWLWRNIFLPAFTGIQIIVSTSINIVRAVISAIATVIRAVSTVVMWLWHNVFQPAFNGIIIVANALYAGVRATFNAIATVIRVVVAPVVNWLWHNVFQPAFQGISLVVQVAVRLMQVVFGTAQIVIKILATVVMWLWNNVFKLAFNGIVSIVRLSYTILRSIFDAIILVIRNYVAPVVTWLWRNVFVPVWNGIVAAARVAWAILRSIFDSVITVIRSYVAPVVTWLWRNIFVPAFNGIGNTARSIWNNFLRPVFILIGNFLTTYVVPAFKKGVSAIGTAWNSLVNVAKAPVRFLIDTIVNKGIIDNFNHLARFFKVGTVSRVNMPRGFSRGGPIAGPGSETSDSVPTMLSANEYVIKARSARKLGYSALDYMNTYGNVPRFQDGGLVARTKAWLPSVDPLPYVWGGVGPRGYDCSGLTGEVYARLSGLRSYHRYMTTASNFRALGFSPGTGTYTIGVSGSHMAGNLAGLGFEAKGSSSGIFVGRGARSPMTFPKQYHLTRAGGQGLVIGDSGGSWFDFLTGPAKAAWNAISGMTKLLSNKILENPYGQAVVGAGKMLISAATNKITSLGNLFDFGNNLSGTNFGNPSRSSAIGIATILSRQRGWSGANLNALIKLWDKESGWNYRAKNPSSSAYGIPQALPGSKMASAGADWATNPTTQIRWGLQYIAERYGNPLAAWAHSQRLNWYNQGGRVRSYDNGGALPPGLSLAYNGTGRSESVIAGDTVSSMSRAQFVTAMTEAVTAALDKAGPFVEINPDINASVLDGLVTYRISQGMSRAAYAAKTGRR